MAEKFIYDPECAVLAKYFIDAEPSLPSTQGAIDNLAQTIQGAVESWFEDRRMEAVTNG